LSINSIMITVIVCTYNRCESLRKTLSSLGQLSAADGSWELVVVDNNSDDDTAEVVRRFAETSSFPTRYFFEIKQGLSYARNAGIRAARGEIIAFTDDDVEVDPHWLSELQRTFDQFECIGVGGRIVAVWTCGKPSWLATDGPHSFRSGTVISFDQGTKPCELRIPPVGANMAFKKVAFERYGLFRTDLGKRGNDPMIGEETEFCARLARARERLVYAPNAIVHHPVAKVRLTKTHFQSHYFHYGRYSARTNSVPDNAKAYFGVPRYLFRSLFERSCKWLLEFDSQKRFRRRLEFFETLGEIYEIYRQKEKRDQENLEIVE
jgi:glucosyl-dolichyl phosphate glucuronosyltransferase